MSTEKLTDAERELLRVRLARAVREGADPTIAYVERILTARTSALADQVATLTVERDEAERRATVHLAARRELSITIADLRARLARAEALAKRWLQLSDVAIDPDTREWTRAAGDSVLVALDPGASDRDTDTEPAPEWLACGRGVCCMEDGHEGRCDA